MRRALPALAVAAVAACDDGAVEAPPPTLVFEHEEAWPEPPLLPPATGPRLALTNSGDDTVSFVDPVTREELARIPVGLFPVEREGPHHLAASPDGRRVYVGISNVVPLVASGPHGEHGTGTADGYLLELDATTGRELRRTRVSRSPGDVRLGPDGRIYQTHFDLVTVGEVLARSGDVREMDAPLTAVDPDTFEKTLEVKVCPAGHGMGFAADGGAAYVTCYMTDELGIVDLATEEVRRVGLGPDAGAPPFPVYQPYALEVAPDGLVWVSATGPSARSLRIVDAAAGDVVGEVATEGAPLFGDFTADGSTLFVVTQTPDALLVVDAAARAVAETVDLGPLGCKSAHAAKLSPDEAQLWIVCEGDHVREPGALLVLDRATREVLGRTEVGLFPDDVALLPAPEAP